MALETPALENPEYLTTQIITYLGNKRALINDIQKEIEIIKKELNKDKLICADLFSGSGIVARMMKQHSSKIIVNDLEIYSKTINSCYLENKSKIDFEKYKYFKNQILEKVKNPENLIEGIISQNYAPKKDENIQKGERVFYTHENALRIDSYRYYIEQLVTDSDYRKYFLAPLISEASIHVNTAGVFKGFYKDKNTGIGCFGGAGKNALSRITGKVELLDPVFSNFESDFELFQKDTVELSSELKNLDLAYLDPPYNQHPYGSNYFMLNLIIKNQIDAKMSRVSGILSNWNRSDFNKRRYALNSMEHIIKHLDSKYIIVSYNSEGFISFENMFQMLEKYGKVKTVEIKYNTFRGSRNLSERNIHVSEYLFVMKKN